MSTYLSLTNELLRRINEVTLDSTEFPDARNIQALAKDSINSSIREILQSAQEWPFTLTTYTQVLTIGTGVYSFQTDASSVDWESFYLKIETTANNTPAKLSVMPYAAYLSTARSTEDQTGTGGYGVPIAVYQTQELKFGVTPKPDVAYSIEYKYWSFPSDLSLYTDEAIIPSRFNTVIIDGALMYLMYFRSNEQSAALHKEKFDQGIKLMRRLLMDEQLYMRSTMIVDAGFSSRTF
jgi:hypothetical protein